MIAGPDLDGGNELAARPRQSPLLAAGAISIGLDALPCCLVEVVPRQISGTALDGGDGDPTLARRRAALAGSYLAGDSVLVSWSRAKAGGQVEVVVGGSSLMGTPNAPKGELAVNLPPGASGTSFEGLRARLERSGHWVPVTGLLESQQENAAGYAARQPLAATLEDAVSIAWHEQFSWLVWATPVPLEEIERRTSALQKLPAFLRAQSSRNQASVTRAERLEARHRELERSQVDGLWDIRVLVGHDSPDVVRRVAALMCTSIDARALPYALRTGPAMEDLESALQWDGPRPTSNDADVAMWPIAGSTDLLAALAFTPRTELPGIRLRVPSTFDVTPEVSGELELGAIVAATGADVGALSISREALKLHTFVCGATGSGKSQTIRHILEAITRAEPTVPWLVIEPAKAEYRLMAGRLEGTPHDVVCIRPGAVDEAPVGLNPLEPEPGFPLQTHVDLVRALFLASFRSEEPFPQVIARALTRCYQEQGWDLALGAPLVDGVRPRYPDLADLQRVARAVVTDVGYGPEVTQDVRGFIDVRLSSLRLGTAGRFLSGGHPLDVAALLSRNVVLELEDVGDDQEKAFLMGLVIIRLYEHMRLRSVARPVRDDELRHVTVVEEAHRLLRRPDGLGQVAHAVELFANLLAEVRAYGEGIVVAEQIPDKIVADVIKNTATKVIHRLPARDDRDAVGATMNLTPAQSEYVVALAQGEAALFSESMDHPVLVRMKLGQARESDEHLGTDLPLAATLSLACGSECRTLPCTLRQVQHARSLLDRDPRVTVWAELVVLSHLLGFPPPRAAEPLLDELRRLAARERQCLLAHALQRAVGTRSGPIARHFSPDELTARAASVIDAQLDGSPAPAGRPRGYWLVGPYRWDEIRAALWEWSEEGQREAPAHPDSAAWRARHGVAVPGGTCAEQWSLVKRWIARVEHERLTVLLGAEQPSALERAVGAARSQERWPTALRESIRAFAGRDYEWPVTRLAPMYVASAALGVPSRV
jgi:hypothetical protein